ncbi:metal ABC transporter permease [Edaphobacillus lindanitolerans]|uniref:Manganese transport system membrane protein MntC n=1 Tax=Edaphobacillus lindanitolerans TaxID=550447 RepID=A0A1U7PIM9_9BACI|nr:metal ABC transporter permease [Edaphobacillus lindanitolerans]SIT74868.1 iron/zinc/copper transport system permease protein [Edaphobacillus lindanitolerans]
MSGFMTDLLNYAFLQKAMFTSMMVGIICGVIGCFIVLRGMSLMGDAISHAVLPGVAISYMIGVNYFYGAVVAGVLTSVGIGFVSEKSRIKNDSAIGIIFSAFFALGIILMAKAASSVDLTSILFGNVLAVRSADMWTTLAIGTIVLLTVIVFYKELLVTTFDPTLAATFGLPNRLFHYAVMVLLTLVTVASLRTVGIILVVAMLITPASTAYLLTDRLPAMIGLSALFGALSAVTGLYVSFNYNLSSGAVIVLAATAMFLLALFFSPKQGLLWRSMRTSSNRKAVRNGN